MGGQSFAPERKNLEPSSGVPMMSLGLGHRMVSPQGLLAIVGRPQCAKRGKLGGHLGQARSAPLSDVDASFAACPERALAAEQLNLSPKLGHELTRRNLLG